MSRIAAPMVGGMVSSTILTLAVIPAIYALVKRREVAATGHPVPAENGEALGENAK
jgi:Cu(I)/Ag(I) efflux system membrane protein CusA/SilA